MEKRCAKCKVIKPIDEFGISIKERDGHRSRCKECRSADEKENYKIHKDVIKKRTAAYYRTHSDRAYVRKIVKRQQDAIRIPMKDSDVALRAKARSVVNNAILYKNFPKASTYLCNVCHKRQAAHYHHHKGYETKHWLDVIPVCTRCHGVIEKG
jgi:hypothetical protein